MVDCRDPGVSKNEELEAMSKKHYFKKRGKKDGTGS